MFELEVSKQMDYVPWKHSPITKTINLVRENTVVLDVGCSYGYVGKELKKKGCKMYGVEIDKDMARVAQREYDEVIISDMDKVNTLPFQDDYFDYILYLDVLEHLARPDVILDKFRRYVKEGGCIIVSLPNIGRWDCRLELLLGRFNYSNTGVVSKGHLRFFTYKTARELIIDSGFKILNIDYTGLASMVRIAPKLTSFQFLITAIR